MAAFHNRYNLGDKHDDRQGGGKRIVPFDDNFHDWDEMEYHIRNNEDGVVILPLYLYDHSGLRIKTSPFGCSWDSGKVGFIYTTTKRIQDMGILQGSGDGLLDDESNDQFKERIKLYLQGEVEVYDQYLSGDVYGFKLMEKGIEDDDTDEIDSCWGFFGDDIRENGILDHLSPEDQPIDEF